MIPAGKEIFFLLNNDDKPKYSDIAALLGISINTVKTQIMLAYQFIRPYNTN
uniref:sigma factor-like helix-turn-helix DNA-binding protein n=1 Tax=Pedobacter sp. FW305-3-2-15-E-R2A2 TaxID=3140251 RepID=UPI00406CCEAC